LEGNSGSDKNGRTSQYLGVLDDDGLSHRGHSNLRGQKRLCFTQSLPHPARPGSCFCHEMAADFGHRRQVGV
jgi:hypothetical protein